jgi:hypothetical protein
VRINFQSGGTNRINKGMDPAGGCSVLVNCIKTNDRPNANPNENGSLPINSKTNKEMEVEIR